MNVFLKRLWLQSKFEFLKLFRMRVYTLLLFLTPSLLYLMSAGNQGVPEQDGIAGRIYLIGSFGTFGLFGIALFGFGLGVALERSQGWTRTLRPAPVPPLLPLLAKLLVCITYSVTALLVLLCVASIFLGVRLPGSQVILLTLVIAGGSVPLGAFALLLGFILGANSAPLVMIVLYIFMSSVSGIIVPLEMVAQGNPMLFNIAPIWPTYHAGQLALAVLRPSPNPIVMHVLALMGFALCFLVSASFLKRFKLERTYG